MAIDRRDGEHQIEFFYALHGGEPIMFAAGSADDLQRAWEECDAIDEAVGPDHSDVIGDGTRHFYTALARTAGIDPELADAVLDHYAGMIQGEREMFRRKLGE